MYLCQVLDGLIIGKQSGIHFMTSSDLSSESGEAQICNSHNGFKHSMATGELLQPQFLQRLIITEKFLARSIIFGLMLQCRKFSF